MSPPRAPSGRSDRPAAGASCCVRQILEDRRGRDTGLRESGRAAVASVLGPVLAILLVAGLVYLLGGGGEGGEPGKPPRPVARSVAGAAPAGEGQPAAEVRETGDDVREPEERGPEGRARSRDVVGPAERREAYLERSLRQLWQLERAIGGLGAGRDAAGALAAGALAASGRAEVGGRQTAAEAVRYVQQTLEDCRGRWHRWECSQAQISLQRLLLQYPGVPAEPARKSLREQAAVGTPPPSEAEIADPWSFRETENQRAVRTARSLVAEVVAGRSDSEAARSWARYAEAFLLAHERQGWYEADSPGYLPISMNALLLLADHAPGERVRSLATRQLHLLFTVWAQNQVRGYPGGAKARAYVHWALTDENVPWAAWRWLIAGLGEAGELNFRDWPDLAATSSYRVPREVARLLAGRSSEPPYAVEERRTIPLPRRVSQDSALHSWVTPDYVLGTSQAVEGLRLRVSGAHRIVVTLYADGPEFAPLYLWSRTENPRGRGGGERWTGDDLAVGHRNVALARLGVGHGGGHAYLAAPWGEIRLRGDLATARSGDTYVALLSPGGWEAAIPNERFPALYQDRRWRSARVLVAKQQPASVVLVAGRRAEDGSFEAFRERMAGARLTVEGGTLRYDPPEGGSEAMVFDPGQWARVGERVLDPRDGLLVEGPFLERTRDGGWRFRYGETRHRFEPVGARSPTDPVADRPQGTLMISGGLE